MKDKKKLLQLRERTSDTDSLCPNGESCRPALFVDMGKGAPANTIQVIEAEAVVILPRVFERTYVPSPDTIQ